MLEQNDLNAIQDLLSQTLLVNNRYIGQRIDERAIKTEKLLLDEIERTRGVLEKQIETVQKNLNEISQYYRITKLENDNTTLLLKLSDELSKSVTELEKNSINKGLSH